MLYKGLIVLLALVALFAQPARAQDDAAASPDLERAMNAVGEMYRLDPDLLMAIAQVESSGRANAVSPKGAQGLMQLMPATAARFDVTDPFDPIDNLLGAARFLDYLRGWQQSDPQLHDLPELLAAYNAGPAAVTRYGGIPPYPETREYVRKVLWAYLLGVAPPRSNDAPVARKLPAPPHPDRDLELLSQLSEIRRERGDAISNSGKSQPAAVSH